MEAMHKSQVVVVFSRRSGGLKAIHSLHEQGHGHDLLLPASFENDLCEDRLLIIEVSVDEPYLSTLGFAGPRAAQTGLSTYRPSTILNIDLFGCPNNFPSGRQREREGQHNIKQFCLTGRLKPDLKTIARFRRATMTIAGRSPVVLCRQSALKRTGKKSGHGGVRSTEKRLCGIHSEAFKRGRLPRTDTQVGGLPPWNVIPAA
jgi:hypothetical protein